MINLKKLTTEQRNEKSMDLDLMKVDEIITLMNEEDLNVITGIKKAIPSIKEVIEIGIDIIKNNGRIIYVGAGTSGRLGILDAVECPPTFGVDYNTFIGLIAGGEKAFIKAQEGAEDSKELAIKDLEEIKVTNKDFIIGIAASGRTPYVLGALEYANKIGCKTASLAITNNAEISEVAQHPIEVIVGPEVITGSTRLKAGTAQKMVLNMISSTIMIKNGKVYQNLMVDVQQTNKKLEQRAINIVCEATTCSQEEAINLLEQANGHAKTAIIMHLNNCDVVQAKKILENNQGFIRKD